MVSSAAGGDEVDPVAAGEGVIASAERDAGAGSPVAGPDVVVAIASVEPPGGSGDADDVVALERLDAVGASRDDDVGADRAAHVPLVCGSDDGGDLPLAEVGRRCLAAGERLRGGRHNEEDTYERGR
jgi:hypothetical protein